MEFNDGYPRGRTVMKFSKSLTASVVVAGLSLGMGATSIVAVSAGSALARNVHAGDNGKSSSSNGSDRSSAKSTNASSKSKGKGKGKYHKLSARYLKNLNAMCSNGKSQSPNSNVYKINAFYAAKALVEDYAGTKAAAEGTLTGYSYPGDSGDISFGSEDFSLSDAIAYETEQAAADPTYDTTNLSALQDYQHALDLESDQYDALATAVRGTARADALVNADPASPEGVAYQTFLNHCSDPA